MAGPRCLDLRPDAARSLGVGRNIGVVGARERWRVELPDCRPQVPLAGFVVLEGDKPRLKAVEPRDRVPTLIEHAAVSRGSRDAESFLALASLNTVKIGRAPESGDRLEQLLGAL
jgi:hypothetical protein